MADVSNIRTDWENVSHQDWLENNAKAQANNISGSEMNTIGNAIISINSELSTSDGTYHVLNPLDVTPAPGTLPNNTLIVRLRPSED